MDQPKKKLSPALKPGKQKKTQKNLGPAMKLGEHLFILDRQLAQTQGRHALTGDAQLRNFIWQELGVYGGGFALAHRIRSQFVLLQQSAYSSPIAKADNIPIIDIPYEPRGHKGDEDRHYLLDLLFISIRGSQPLTGQRPANPPEVYLRLPNALPSSRLGSVPQPMVRSLFDEEFSDDPGFNFLYCGAGEVLFHLYAWRWLLRYCQMTDGNSPVEPDREIKLGDSPASYWKKDFWNQASGQEPGLEMTWINRLEEERDHARKLRVVEKGEREEETERFLSKAINAWDKDRYRCEADYADATYDFYHEWRMLGLVDDEGKATFSLIALLRFAQRVAQKVKETCPEADCAAKSVAADHIAEAEGKLTASILAGAPAEIEEVKGWNVDRAIRQVAYCSLKASMKASEEERPTGFQLFEQLHAVTRFSIIPFFYWIALDAKKRVKEHLVFPVWQSYRPENKAFIDLPGGDGKTETVQTGMVALALVGIRPVWEQSEQRLNTLALVEGEADTRILERFYNISAFFSQVASPIIDQGFGGLNAKLASRYRDAASGHEATAQLEAASVLLPYYGRQRIADAIKGSLAYAQFFLSPMSGNALVKEWVIEQQRPINEWILLCAEAGWKIAIARESRDAIYDSEVSIIEQAMAIAPSVTVAVNQAMADEGHISQQLYLTNEGSREELDLLSTNLTRWLLAALSNAFKWCHPKTVDDYGIKLLSSWTEPDDFNRVRVEVESYRSHSGIRVFNPLNLIDATGDEISNTYKKKTGTEGVLRAVTDSIPPKYPVSRIIFEESARKVGETVVREWETSILFSCNIFSV